VVRIHDRPCPMIRLASAATVATVMLSLGCSSTTPPSAPASKPDTDAARRFRAFPLYWLGPRFEKWDLATILGLEHEAHVVTLIYGTCTPKGGGEPSCSPPLDIQISRLCAHLVVIAADPIWRKRTVRSAPVGRNPDGAPVLFTSRAQVKVYRGEGSDPGLPLRALHALRSLNAVPPVVGDGDPFPGPAPEVLAGARRCR
jgi:hypothetical protein